MPENPVVDLGQQPGLCKLCEIQEINHAIGIDVCRVMRRTHACIPGASVRALVQASPIIKGLLKWDGGSDMLLSSRLTFTFIGIFVEVDVVMPFLFIAGHHHPVSHQLMCLPHVFLE